jgi:hypothetical protein
MVGLVHSNIRDHIRIFLSQFLFSNSQCRNAHCDHRCAGSERMVVWTLTLAVSSPADLLRDHVAHDRHSRTGGVVQIIGN